MVIQATTRINIFRAAKRLSTYEAEYGIIGERSQPVIEKWAKCMKASRECETIGVACGEA